MWIINFFFREIMLLALKLHCMSWRKSVASQSWKISHIVSYRSRCVVGVCGQLSRHAKFPCPLFSQMFLYVRISCLARILYILSMNRPGISPWPWLYLLKTFLFPMAETKKIQSLLLLNSNIWRRHFWAHYRYCTRHLRLKSVDWREFHLLCKQNESCCRKIPCATNLWGDTSTPDRKHLHRPVTKDA